MIYVVHNTHTMKLLLEPENKKLQIFCDIIGNFKYLCDFITFNFSEAGIYSQGLSMDHCSVFEMTIKEDWFADFEWDSGKDAVEISISTEILSKILATRQPSQYMVIEYYGKPDSITIRFSSTATKSVKTEFPKEFSIPLMDVDWEKLSIPPMEYSAEFGIGSKSLHATNEQLSLFNETLTIHCSEDEIYLRSKGNDGQLKVTLFDEKCEHITEFSIEEDLSLTLDFSIKHFNTFCRFLKVSDNVNLGFKKDTPMKFEYAMEDENIELAFYLAPKISDDE